MDTNKHENLLHKELSYQIQGAAIEVRKNFGSGLKETIYQNAFAEELKVRNIKFNKEKSIQIFSPKTGKLIGSYRPDFIVDEKVLIELKAVEKIPKLFLDQLYSYLRNSKYELGYFINFSSPKLYIKRIIFTNDRKFFKLRNLLVVLSFILVSISVLSVNAAQLNLISPLSEIGIGQEFQIDLMLDAESQDINAVEGNIIFQKNLLEVKEIHTGSSIVNFWIERPAQKNGEIKFSGIIPGGFSGILSPYYKGEKPGKILSVILSAKKEGAGEVEIRGVKVLLNDGKGTEADLKISSFRFTIREIPPIETRIDTKKDTDPPELFTPEIARDPNIFDGKWFLVFAAQDKISGIDGYFVHETTRKKDMTQINTNEWIKAQSPHLLTDQKLKSYIYVKAVDKASNSRIVYLPPKIKWYQKPIVYIPIIFGIFIGVIIIIRWLWRLQSKKHE